MTGYILWSLLYVFLAAGTIALGIVTFHPDGPRNLLYRVLAAAVALVLISVAIGLVSNFFHELDMKHKCDDGKTQYCGK